MEAPIPAAAIPATIIPTPVAAAPTLAAAAATNAVAAPTLAAAAPTLAAAVPIPVAEIRNAALRILIPTRPLRIPIHRSLHLWPRQNLTPLHLTQKIPVLARQGSRLV